MLVFLQYGGLHGGGINFDAKIRRNSTDQKDIFYAHIGGVDTFARSIIAADKIISSSDYQKLRDNRYHSFDSASGKDFEEGRLQLKDLFDIAAAHGEPQRISGRQEYFENIVNQYI